MPATNPDMLVWARETAGFSLEQAAAKLGIKDARGTTAVDRLAALEAGDPAPSRPLLLKMAKLYRRPLLSFYLRTRPPKGDRGEDFRTLPERHSSAEPIVDALVRDIRARQSMVRAILEDQDDVRPLTFVGSLNQADGVGHVLAALRQTLDVDLPSFRAQGSADAAFALLRAKVEAAGIFVMLVGNLGSHHTALDVEVFRGFALADQVAPFVVINDQDARSAWSFTLLHEVAHLWLGASGVSGANADSQLEQFCNDVASNFLLPISEINLVGVDQGMGPEVATPLITRFAEERLLSRSLVAYRLFRIGLLTEGTWRELTTRYRAEWRQSRLAQRERDRAQEGGPNYYVVRRHRLGSALLRLVARTMSEGELTPTKAAKILGVKPRSVDPLLRGAALPAGQAA